VRGCDDQRNCGTFPTQAERHHFACQEVGIDRKVWREIKDNIYSYDYY
jgi:hypothetical protein